MKKTIFKWLSFFVMAVVCVGFASCGDDDDDVPDQNYYVLVNGTSLSTHSFPGRFDSGKSGIDYKQSFKISSNVQWAMSGQVDWLNVSSVFGSGDIDLTIYPTSTNPSATPRSATLVLSGGGTNAIIKITQSGGLPSCYVVPDNTVALYDRISWEFSASENANNFHYMLLSSSEYNRLTDREMKTLLMQTEEYKYADGWLMVAGSDAYGNRISSNSTYYIVTIASDKDNDEYGELQKTSVKTPVYKDANDDAWVSFSNFSSSTYSFQFNATKRGLASTYHLIYGSYTETQNSGIFAFQINYYVKYRKMHWLAEMWDWEIKTNYPNNDLFTYYDYTGLYDYCFAYGWGVFANGSLSSDLIGFQNSTNSAPQARVAQYTDAPEDIIIKRSELTSKKNVMNK